MRHRRRPQRPAAGDARPNAIRASAAVTGYACPDQRLTPSRSASLAGPRHLSDWFTLPRVEPVHWYGSGPAWRVALEARARREYGSRLSVRLDAGRLTYTIDLGVPGRIHPVPVTISFYDTPPYNCYGLPPADYPRVHAEPGALSPHRMPSDDALCLWYPLDPAERRWTADKGPLDLLDITTSHLLYEAHWRATGGASGGVWAGDQAAHGFAEEAA
jgi:hypothetical protein